MSENISLVVPQVGQLVVQSTEQKTNPALLYLASLSKGQSRDRMLAVVNDVARFFGYQDLYKCPWENLTYQAVLAMRTFYTEKDTHPAVVNLKLNAIRGVAKNAWLTRQITLETYNEIKSVPSVPNQRIAKGRSLNRIEVRNMINSCLNKDSLCGMRNVAMIALATSCGLRRDELSKVRLVDIDWTQGQIKILGKGSKERMVYPNEETMYYLKNWYDLRGTEGEYLFCVVIRGTLFPFRKLGLQAVYNVIKNAAREGKVDNVAPHDLRRTFATRMFEYGAEIGVVRRAMGHCSVTITELYDKRDQEVVKQYSSKINF